MLALWTKLVSYIQDEERGASMVEYALLVVLIAIVAIAAITIVGTQVSSAFDTVGEALGG